MTDQKSAAEQEAQHKPESAFAQSFKEFKIHSGLAKWKKGDTFPNRSVDFIGLDGSIMVASTAQLFSGKKVIVFGTMGAYVPTSHETQLPGFLDKFEQLHSVGVTLIVGLSCNDQFVLKHWQKELGALGKIGFIADWNMHLTSSLGMSFNWSKDRLGERTRHFVMLLDDNIIQYVGLDNAALRLATGSNSVANLHEFGIQAVQKEDTGCGFGECTTKSKAKEGDVPAAPPVAAGTTHDTTTEYTRGHQ